MDINVKIKEYQEIAKYSKIGLNIDFLRQRELIEVITSNEINGFQKVNDSKETFSGFELYTTNESKEYALVKKAPPADGSGYIYCLLDYSDESKVEELVSLIQSCHKEPKNLAAKVLRIAAVLFFLITCILAVMAIEESTILTLVIIVSGFVQTVFLMVIAKITEDTSYIRNKLL